MDNKLLKILGVGFGVAVTLGGTIGTGILRKPGPIAAELGDPGLIMLVWVLDRKSTRLNSSHVKISYAVFCLKKKQIHVVDVARTALAELIQGSVVFRWR